jgi:hypothetical protein
LTDRDLVVALSFARRQIDSRRVAEIVGIAPSNATVWSGLRLVRAVFEGRLRRTRPKGTQR